MDALQFNKAMGAVVNGLRRAHGLSQNEVGQRLGVSPQQQSKYESGENAFSAHYIAELAKIFSVSVASMYGQASIVATDVVASPAENDAYLASHHVRRIRDSKLRRAVIDFTQRLAYSGAEA